MAKKITFISGGIDKREIAKGRRAIDRELERMLPPLFRRGGYLPSMDHHVPPEVSYDDFRYYVQRVHELYEQHGARHGPHARPQLYEM